MPFELDKFQAAEFRPRTETVRAPALAPFFGEGEEPAFVVRGLTGAELARVHDVVERNRGLAKLVEAVASGTASDAIRGVQRLLGLTDDVPHELARRMALVEQGSVEPRLDMPAIVKMAETHPITLYTLSNTITDLTGQGSTLGKSAPCGEMSESVQP